MSFLEIVIGLIIYYNIKTNSDHILIGSSSAYPVVLFWVSAESVEACFGGFPPSVFFSVEAAGFTGDVMMVNAFFFFSFSCFSASLIGQF